MHISPAFFEQLAPFRHITFAQCTFTIDLNDLPVNFARTKILAFKNRITHRTSQVARFSIFMSILTTTAIWRVPIDTQKMTALHSKCTRHLRGRYARSVLTLWTHLVIILVSQLFPSLTSYINPAAYKISNNFPLCSSLRTQPNLSKVQ